MHEELVLNFQYQFFGHLQVFPLSLTSEAISFCGKSINALSKDIRTSEI